MHANELHIKQQQKHWLHWSRVESRGLCRGSSRTLTRDVGWLEAKERCGVKMPKSVIFAKPRNTIRITSNTGFVSVGRCLYRHFLAYAVPSFKVKLSIFSGLINNNNHNNSNWKWWWWWWWWRRRRRWWITATKIHHHRLHNFVVVVVVVIICHAIISAWVMNG